ncbi:hypothetical protein CkaCkLH20_05183 [Colletotrichum karsti]|uniref:Uncharacterized protein n=1 Tax=Colletotrichum karsti TaxID=1095194 RepID=A0A9P6LL79_9PEZI|nr:uncharacterized protein CkaCkLH20_05183 [Colletotrichum karsti]KAF9877483.1 hypothetical protein CkaCkLH20_05183 [Colletotrichum karsti]
MAYIIGGMGNVRNQTFFDVFRSEKFAEDVAMNAPFISTPISMANATDQWMVNCCRPSHVHIYDQLGQWCKIPDSMIAGTVDGLVVLSNISNCVAAQGGHINAIVMKLPDDMDVGMINGTSTNQSSISKIMFAVILTLLVSGSMRVVI